MQKDTCQLVGTLGLAYSLFGVICTPMNDATQCRQSFSQPKNGKVLRTTIMYDACLESFLLPVFFVKIKKTTCTLQLFGSLLFFHAHY